MVERYLDCSHPRYGFARIRCPDCGEERLLMFSCRTRGFCPSCHAKRTSHIPDKGQVTGRYYGLYANAHRGKLRKATPGPFPLPMVNDELRPLPAKGWAEIRRKVYEVDPMVCPRCGGAMKIIAFLTDYSVVDRIIYHLKLTFVAERPPPPPIAYQKLLMAAETSTEYLS